MMFTTKKTRAVSAFAAILMLLSLMTCFVLPVSAEEDEVYVISQKLYMDGAEVMDLGTVEMAPQAVVDVNALDLSAQGYELDKEALFGDLTRYEDPETGAPGYCINSDITAKYYPTVVVLDPLTDLADLLGSYDASLFEDGAEGTIEAAVWKINGFLKLLEDQGIESGVTTQEEINTGNYLDAEGNKYNFTDLCSDIAFYVNEGKKPNLVLKNTWPDLPNYSEVDTYLPFLAAGEELAGYMIADIDDWFAILKDSQVKKLDFAGIKFYLKNDINLAEKEVPADRYEIIPSFAGELYGCGYSFLNVKINEEASNCSVGLIGVLKNGGKIEDLGIASGTVTVKYSSDTNTYGIGALVGYAESGAMLRNVWNAASVTVTGSYGEEGGVTKKDYPVAGLVGYAETGVLLNGAYNLGAVTGGDKVADLVNGAADVYNSYAVGAVLANTTGSVVNSKLLPADADRMAFGYELNAGYQFPTGYNQSYTAIRYTLSSGELVFADNDQIVRVSVDVTPEAGSDADAVQDYQFLTFANTEIALDVSYAVAGTYAVTPESDASVNADTGVLKVGSKDVTVTVDVKPLDSTALRAALALYEGKDAEVFADPEMVNVLARARKNNYATAAEMAADVAFLNENINKYTDDKAKLPAVSDMALYAAYPAPGYTIRTVEDLKAVAAAPAADYKALYLANDLDLSGVAFDGINGLAVVFDGLNNTISGWSDADGNFFAGFAGGTIKNLTFAGARVTGTLTASTALIANDPAAELTFENVHVKSSVMEKAVVADLGFFVGTSDVKITINKSSVVDSSMLAAVNSYVIDRGLLVGSTAADIAVKNVVAAGNTLTGVDNTAGAGILVAEAGANADFANIAIYNNKVTAKGIALALLADADTAVVDNIFANNNRADYGADGTAKINVAIYGAANPASVVVTEKTYDNEAATAMLATLNKTTDGYVEWTLDSGHKCPTLAIGDKAPAYTITFKFEDDIVASYHTDEFGHLYDFDAKTSEVSKYVWADEYSNLATYVFTGDEVLNAEAAEGAIEMAVNGTAEKNRIVLDVNVTKNPGMKAMALEITLNDARFEIVGFANGNLFESMEGDPAKSMKVILTDSDLVTAAGTAMKVVLRAVSDEIVAGTEYTDVVSVKVTQVVDAVYNNVVFNEASCNITLTEVQWTWGDVTDEGEVTSADVSAILKYVVGLSEHGVKNAAAGELDTRAGLDVIDAQIIFRALYNNAEADLKPMTVA
ncbi:MAG: hypothetical protein IJ407_01670 [Clostridia bacterium]|nr:hypothetical protein [Clostridia bacterium]